MRKFTYLFAFLVIVAFQACEGPPGPAGRDGLDGLDGLDGVNIVGTTYEVEIDFVEEEDYSALFEFPVELVDSDAVLVYMLSGNDEGRDVWRALPQTIYFEEGVLVYNFDYTVADFSIFLDGPIDYSILGPEWTDAQIFRVIVVPSDFPDARIDLTDYEAVTKMLDISDEDFIRVDQKQ